MERINRSVVVIGVASFAVFVVVGLALTQKNDAYCDLEKLERIYVAIEDLTSSMDLPCVVTIDGQAQSWRVALYPYLINDHFALKYDTKQSFDSLSNLNATQSLSTSGRGFGLCYYTTKGRLPETQVPSTVLRVTGPRTLGVGLSYRRIERGLSNIILLIEDPRSRALWTSHEDFDVTTVSDATIISWLHESRRIALFANGDIRALSVDTTPKEFRDMCNIDGDKSLPIQNTRLLSSRNKAVRKRG